MNHKFKFTCIASTLSIIMSAQAPYWKLGGNPTFGTDAVSTTNNYLGTSGTNNTYMRIGVQASQDIFIDNDNSKLLPADASGRLHGGHWIGMGRVFTPTNGPGAFSFFTPKAHLHIDGGNNSGQWGSFGSGTRSWMNTGTLYTENSDAMYVGLKSIGSNFSYAVINWSDDAYGGNAGTDFLSFNFTGAPGVLAPTANGMELGRFSPTQGRGTFGIGNFQFIGASTEPVRRLEILDADPSNGVNANAPQLRTTYTYNATPTGGVFTEFQTTNLGDMYFNTRSNSNARRFGFHDNTPGNTVEITANGSSPIPIAPNGSSGLRFTNMTSANTPQANPGAGVLSVNSNGDVIYVPGGGAGIANNGLSVNGGIVQLGVPCTLPSGFPNFPGIAATGLTVDRVIPNRNQNLWVASLNTETGGFGVGGQPASVGFCNVGNTMEISANLKNTKYGNVGASGLRFTKLLSTSPTIPNGTYGVNSSKVLTVDKDGDVVLTDANNTIGNYCSASAQNALAGDFEIPLNIFNYYYSGQGTGRTNVGIGFPCSQNLGGKLHVYQIANNMMIGQNLGISIAGRFDNYASGPTTLISYGVVGNSMGTGTGYNIGVYGQAANAAGLNYAGFFQGDVFTTGGSTSGSGYLVASDKNIKTDVNRLNKNLEIISKLRPVDYKYDNTYAPQLTLNNHRNYGFIAQEVESVVPGLVTTSTIMATYDSLGNVINPEKAISALNYDGLIPFAIGGIQELNTKQTEMQANLDKLNLSDAQVKTNVNNFNALTKVKSLNPVSYNFTNANVPQLTFKSNLDYGFVAQQLETVYPELVDTIRVGATYDSAGVVVNPSKVLKSVNYKAMSALLVRSIQEQQLTIDSLRSAHSKQDSINQSVQQQLAALASQINSCCSAGSNARNSNSNLNQLDIELSDKDAIVLNQNVPNPFAEQTTITYNVPASVEKAQLLFFNANGQVIQTVDIKTRGKGKVNVFASDLSSGLYHYTLVADGKVVDSKKMVRE